MSLTHEFISRGFHKFRRFFIPQMIGFVNLIREFSIRGIGGIGVNVNFIHFREITRYHGMTHFLKLMTLLKYEKYLTR